MSICVQAHAQGFAIDVATLSGKALVYRRDALGKRRVILLERTGGHYDLVVAIKGDDVQDLYPLQHGLSRFIEIDQQPEDLPSSVVHDWRQLYLGHGVMPDKATEWMTWDVFIASMDATFGNSYSLEPVRIDCEKVRSDYRIQRLAGWASFHRTSVRVSYNGDFVFQIAPEFYAVAHHNARLGRIRHVELGVQGVRNYFVSDLNLRGSRAERYVFNSD